MLLIGFDAATAFPRDQVDLAVFVPDGDRDVLSHSCQLDLSMIPTPATVVWEFWHQHSEWRPVDLIRDSGFIGKETPRKTVAAAARVGTAP